MENKEIVDIKELAEYLSCGISTIRKLIYNNEIPYFKILSKYYFNISLINKWILNRHNDIELGGDYNDVRRNYTKI